MNGTLTPHPACCICCSGVSSKHSTPLARSSRTRANIHASVFSTFNTSSLFLQTHFRNVWALFACIWPFGLFSVRLPVQLHVCLAFFFPICFFFFGFFSLFPFTAFPTELLPGWLILILTLLINWLFFKVISICPSAGGTASSQHSLANPSSSLCRLPLVQVMVLFGPDDKAWAKWLRIMGSFQGEQAAGPFTHSFVSYVHTFSVTTYPKLMLTPAVRRQNWGAKKKKRSYICLRKCEW